MCRYLCIVFGFSLIVNCVSASNLELNRIDGTTNESYKSSLQKLLKTLDKKQQTELDLAIIKLHFVGVSSIWVASNQNKFLEIPSKETKAKLHGFTFQDIITLAASFKSVDVLIAGQEPGLSEEFKKPLETTINLPIINLSGTSWLFTTNTNGHIKHKSYKFMPNGTLKSLLLKQNTEIKSTWQQEGDRIRISFSNNYAVYLGSLESESLIKGKSTNINGFDWTWIAEILTDE
jgi:hypothetical protein